MSRLYKGKYLIVFYDKYDEEFRYVFDNVREILKFMGKDINRQSVNAINVMLCRALRTNHIIKFLTNEQLTVHIVDYEGEDEYEVCENSINKDN